MFLPFVPVVLPLGIYIKKKKKKNKKLYLSENDKNNNNWKRQMIINWDMTKLIMVKPHNWILGIHLKNLILCARRKMSKLSC